MGGKKIAVIGGGVFGCTSAIYLAKIGFEVSIFESKDQILNGATRNSQNRLHLGLHYPRDLPTAIQSRIGYSQFIERFPNATRVNFDNFYALASQESKITTENFLKFVLESGISIQALDNNEIITLLGLDQKNIAGIWKCQEGVIDMKILSRLILDEIDLFGVRLYLSNEVLSVNLVKKKWNVCTNQGFSDEFDWIIRATYGQDDIKSNLENLTRKEYEYHQTMILEVESPTKTFGFTVIDGDFLTILPNGNTNNFLIYAPTISVRNKLISTTYPKSWNMVNRLDQSNFTQQIVDRLHSWLPNFDVANVATVLQTIRSIDPYVSATDRRMSSMELIANNFIDLWSGKIDHCIDIAEKVCREVSSPS